MTHYYMKHDGTVRNSIKQNEKKHTGEKCTIAISNMRIFPGRYLPHIFLYVWSIIGVPVPSVFGFGTATNPGVSHRQLYRAGESKLVWIHLDPGTAHWTSGYGPLSPPHFCSSSSFFTVNRPTGNIGYTFIDNYIHTGYIFIVN